MTQKKDDDETPKSVELDDLNHQPNLIDELDDKAILKLAKEADSSDLPLAGNVRSALNTRASSIIADREASNSETED